jgi:hypothetical protein
MDTKGKIITRILENEIDYGYRYEIQENRVFENGTESGYHYGISLYDLEEVAELRDALTSFLAGKDYLDEEQ